VPISNPVLMRATAAFTAVGMLVLLAMVMLSYLMLARTDKATEEVLATREIRAALIDLFSVLQDAETGQRSYLLTTEDKYLAPYDAAVRSTDNHFQKLEEVIRRQQGSEAFLKNLRSAIDEKLAELSKTVELKKAGNLDEAMALVRSDAGKDLMDRIRDMIALKREKVEGRLNAAVASQRENAATLRWSVISGGLLILLAGGGLAWALTTYTRELIKARAEVESLNVGLEQRVRERTQDLQRANEEIQRFAYVVSHDLRAPLVNVMGFTSELKSSLGTLDEFMADPAVDQTPAAADARAAVATDIPEALSFIQASTKKMDSLINAILKLSREGQRTLRPEPIALQPLFEGIAANVQHRLQEADGELIIEKPLPALVNDRLALEQVFGNLVDNAIKYRSPARAPRIVVRARDERSGDVVIEVQDNGRGIAEQDFERVFDLFRRAGAQDQPGEGIGLAHARALVRRLGGKLTLTSELGAGTTFQVRLPRTLKLKTEDAG